jgi:hypothetical protein
MDIFLHKNKKYDLTNKDLPADVEEEVEIMKQAWVDPDQLYLLITTDPAYYINIIENYKGEDLQELFNLRINRDKGKLTIKFKIFSDDKWTDVGFFNNGFDDSDTLDEFCLRVELRLNSKMDNRANIMASLDNDLENKLGKTQKVANVNVESISKMDITEEMESWVNKCPENYKKEYEQLIDEIRMDRDPFVQFLYSIEKKIPEKCIKSYNNFLDIIRNGSL